MRKSLLVLPLLVAALAGGCSTPPPLDPAVPLNVSAAPGGSLRLVNASARPIYYTVMERDFAARANWAPCTRPDQCPKVEPHGSARVEFGRITGYQPGAREAVVYWWHLLESDGGWVVDHVRSVVVDL